MFNDIPYLKCFISLEIGLDSNPWVFIPSKDSINMSSTVVDDVMTARGNCYSTCFESDLPEMTLHSIMGFGSRNVKKMKILKLTDGQMEKPCDNCQRIWFRLYLRRIYFVFLYGHEIF